MVSPQRFANVALTLAPLLAQPCLAQPGDMAPYTETISGTTVSFEMLPIPAGTVELKDPETGETRQVEVGPFWMARTETTWDMYDVFVYELDTPQDETDSADDDENGEAEPSPVDAVSRPSKPYIPPDRGFGHAGYPAISLTRQGAEKFCEWLSVKTGRRYRLPTPEEWTHAAGASADTAYFFGDDPAQLSEYGWFAENTEESTQPVATKQPNPHGLHDVYGNVGEWVATKPRVLMGGAFKDPADMLTTRSSQKQDRSWNETDPQIPKSPWWLSDGPFAGFRILCEPGDIDPPGDSEGASP